MYLGLHITKSCLEACLDLVPELEVPVIPGYDGTDNLARVAGLGLRGQCPWLYNLKPRPVTISLWTTMPMFCLKNLGFRA